MQSHYCQILKKYLKNLCTRDYTPFLVAIILFGFRQQYSASHTLIDITENKKKALDDVNLGCGVVENLETDKKLLIL